ncbi:hypothetical protein ACFL5K_04345 [Gemmatimonadota bacterium]
MKEGTKPILIHAVHSTAVFVMMSVVYILGSILGDIDDGERYTFFYRYGHYTFLYSLYTLQITFFFIVLLFGSVQPVPYTIMYWFKYQGNHEVGNKTLAIYLTVTVFIIIAVQLGMILNFKWLEKYLLLLPGCLVILFIHLFIYLVSYIIPFLFIRLSYPQCTTLSTYKAYKFLLLTQFFICLFCLTFFMGAFPEIRESIKTFIDSRYSRW